jgi:NAD(P)-dependent dehydrogenase (short-subunit alcohol dehydrogenase family)
MITLSGKNILVTGASSGIGREIAVMASSLGAAVTITGRNEERLKETMQLLHGEGHKIIAADFTNAGGIETLVKESSPYNAVVFNAGVVEYTPVKFITPQKIDTVFSVNLTSTMLLCQQLLKNKLIIKKGSLVFISSISSKLGVPGTALYAASKAALTSFAKVTAAECAAQGIRSNSICPGIVITPMTGQAAGVVSEEEMKKAAADYPLGYGEPGDVAGLVMYLLADISRWMTGSELIIDGGFTLK